MSCGAHLRGRFNGEFELADKLEDEGEYRLASKVRRNECLDDYEMRQARQALDVSGFNRHFDYEEEPCLCENDYGMERER